MLQMAVMASGGGSNLQALLDHFNATSRLVARVALVISDRPTAGALDRARASAVETVVIPVRDRDPAEVATATLDALGDAGIGLIVLAGYLKLIPADVVRAFRGRIINIHPALLPAFGGHGMYGMHVHRAVIAAGCFVTGVTVHHVDERYDEGHAIAQWPVPVLHGDTAESLVARVLRVEHALYPAAIEALALELAETSPATAERSPGTNRAHSEAMDESGSGSQRAGRGFRAVDPISFGYVESDGIGEQIRRLLLHREERT